MLHPHLLPSKTKFQSLTIQKKRHFYHEKLFLRYPFLNRLIRQLQYGQKSKEASSVSTRGRSQPPDRREPGAFSPSSAGGHAGRVREENVCWLWISAEAGPHLLDRRPQQQSDRSFLQRFLSADTRSRAGSQDAHTPRSHTQPFLSALLGE